MGTRTNFICSECGKYEVPFREGRSQCKKCEGVYLREWKKQTGKQKAYNKKIAQKRRKVKEFCILYLGGICQYKPSCATPLKEGFEPCLLAFHFHHRDPSAKMFDISRRLRNKGTIKGINSISDLKKADPELVEELDKCDLLCSNCHHRVEYCCTRTV